MSLDPRYIIASDLQSLFRDKDTGAPLRGGLVTFYKDNARTQLKKIYKLSGSPPNYSYTELPNPIELTGIGTFSDIGPGGSNANDIVPYYFPYVSQTDSTVELYYITVESSTETSQFTREAWPNFVRDSSSTQNLINYVPNGQFLLHTNLPETDLYDAGEIRAAVTNVAYGGWTFNRPNASVARDIVTFVTIGTASVPDANPKFAIRISDETPSIGDAYKDLRLQFDDVNKFASNTQQYTFAIAANTNTGSTLQVQLYSIKHFGSGGSPDVETPIAAFDIQPSSTISSASFTFGTNENYTLGTGGDDYVALAIRFPVSFIFDMQLTDVVLTPGEVAVSGFPQTTDAEFVYASLAGGNPVPDYNGADLYLPIIQGPTGYTYDTSQVGEIGYEVNQLNYTSSISTVTNKLLCDGSQYLTLGYSPLGIPYSRLQAKLWNSTYNVPFYGTGKSYVTSFLGLNANAIALHPNTAGAVTATADGSTATGFSFTAVATGNTGYYMQSYWLGNNQLILQNVNTGAVAAVDAGSSTFTTTEWRVGSTLLQETTLIQTVAASSLAVPGGAGKYVKLQSYNSGVVKFYVWYQITNETDPAPASSGTGIKINLGATDTDVIVAQKTSNVLNGWQPSIVGTTAASAITAGSYWIFNSTAAGYYVWYSKDGGGVDPAPASRTGIKVSIVGADTNAQVATKTISAINSVYFAVPDFRGQFLEGYDPNRTIDKSPRFSLVENINGMMFGSFQLDENLSHNHTFLESGFSGAGSQPLGSTNQDIRNSDAILYSGSYNSRPRNAVVNTFIRY